MFSDALPGIIEQAVNSTATQLLAACEEDAGSSTELEFSAVGVNPGGSVAEPLLASSTAADADTDGAIAEVDTSLHDSTCLSEEDAAPTEFQSVVEASHEVVNIAASRASSAVVTTPSVVVIDVEVAGNENPSGSNVDVCLWGNPAAADARAARTNEIASGEVTLGAALLKPSESTISCEKSDELAGTCPAASPTEQELVETSDYLAKIPTRYQRAKIRHQAKKRPGQWSVSRSRKRRYQMKCSVTKSGSNIYHARSLKAQKIKKLLRSPGVLGRMRSLHKRRPVYAEPTQDDRLIMDEVQWPAGIKEIDECVTNGVTFPDIGDYHSCECVGDCFMDTCANINTAVYCTPECCKLGALCSNAPRSRETLKLFDTRRVGLGVYTTTDLDVGDIVGEYTGTLCEYAALLPGQPNQAMKENSGYTMLYNAMSSRKKFVYVEALKCGSITRFLSHACEPNAAFVELQNRTSVKVLVKMIEDVKAGAEITVHYGDETWFKCACDNCWEENEADTVE